MPTATLKPGQAATVQEWRKDVVPVFVALLAVALGAWNFIGPTRCQQTPECADVESVRANRHHSYLVIGLFALMVREASGLGAAYLEQRSSPTPTSFVKNACTAPGLLCCILAALMIYETFFSIFQTPWAHVRYDGRPVYTLRYCEWSITVPLLLTLSGGCALGRPLRELAAPVIATQVYLVIAWAGPFFSFFLYRWAFVAAVFILYGFASYWMLQWVQAFLSNSSKDAPCKWLRISSVLMLIMLFAMYGIIYLQALAHIISPQVEEISYSLFGFGCKVVMSMIFTAIRVMEYHSELNGLLCRISGVSTAFMSLLRSNFDFVVPCLADPGGMCHLPPTHSGDSQELERCIGRSVLGTTFNDLLAGAAEKRRFATYVQNVWRTVVSQPDGTKAAVQMSWDAPMSAQGQSLPPMAQVIHVKFECSPVADSGAEYVSAVVHLSVVPQSGRLVGMQQRMILGVRLDTEGAATSQLFAAADAKVTGPVDIPSPGSTTTGGPGSTQDGSSTTDALMQSIGASASECGSVAGGEGEKPKVTPAVQRLAKHMEKKMKAKKRAGQRAAAKAALGEKEEKPQGEAAKKENPFEGAWDASSQSSKLSYIGSVTQACRQLLGPLHEGLPPKELVSKRIEDHVGCASDQARLKAAAKITKLHNDQEVASWEEQKQAHVVSKMLGQSQAPEGIQEEIWRQHMLPNLTTPAPGARPEEYDVPDDAELWYQAWKSHYEPEDDDDEDDDDDEEEEEDPADIRADPRMQTVVAAIDQRRQQQQQPLPAAPMKIVEEENMPEQAQGTVA